MAKSRADQSKAPEAENKGAAELRKHAQKLREERSKESRQAMKAQRNYEERLAEQRARRNQQS